MSFQRVDNKKFHHYLLDGRRIPGVTTLIGDGVPKPALPPWAARIVAERAVDMLDELPRMGAQGAVDWLKGEPNRVRDSQGDKGRQIHEAIANVVEGKPWKLPPEHEGYVDAFLQFVEDWRPDFQYVETSIVNRRWYYAGTFDLAGRVNGGNAVVDVKTGDSGVWAETCLQVAAYRAAEHMVVDGREVPMIQTDAGYALWLTEDRYELVPLASGPDVFAVFLHAAHVAAFQRAAKKDDAGFVGAPLPIPEAVAS